MCWGENGEHDHALLNYTQVTSRSNIAYRCCENECSFRWWGQIFRYTYQRSMCVRQGIPHEYYRRGSRVDEETCVLFWASIGWTSEEDRSWRTQVISQGEKWIENRRHLNLRYRSLHNQGDWTCKANESNNQERCQNDVGKFGWPFKLVDGTFIRCMQCMKLHGPSGTLDNTRRVFNWCEINCGKYRSLWLQNWD